MLWGQLQELLDLLSEEEYRTAVTLAKEMSISEKTVRIRVKELNELLAAHGAAVLSKPRYGYLLKVSHPAEYLAYRKEQAEPGDRIPDKKKERSEYLLAFLIARKEYIKIEELCDFLFVSGTTLSNSIKSVEAILKRYSLRIDRKPGYGIKIEGSEFDIRRLMSDYFIKRHCLAEVDLSHQDQELSQLAGIVKGLLASYGIHLSEMSFENFVEYVYVAWKRIKGGFYLSMNKESLPEMGMKEQAFIRELITVMESWGDIRYTTDESNYLLLYLAGKRMIGNVVENDSNFIIREQTDRLTLAMMDLVSREYGLNLHQNFEIRMTLNQHLVPFDIRIRYDIPLKNPMLEDIKQKYSLAYQMSYEACGILQDHYKKDISEDEIGYFALIFQLALEKDKIDSRSSILVVCSTGKGSSRLLKYRYENEFAGYLKEIYVCDLIGLETFDFHQVDYVFATVPITKEIPVPIVEVGVFLEADDIQKITGILRSGNNRTIMTRYYTPARFLTRPGGRTKEDILADICDVIKRQEDVAGNFYELVLERESFAQMDYGNLIAIPHPNEIASEETFAYVTVLDEPVVWNRLPVRIILLTSVGRRADENRQKFYESTARFALDKEAVRQLIAEPSYEVLIQLLGN